VQAPCVVTLLKYLRLQDKERSQLDCYSRQLDLLQIGGIQKATAMKLMNGIDIEHTGDGALTRLPSLWGWHRCSALALCCQVAALPYSPLAQLTRWDVHRGLSHVPASPQHACARWCAVGGGAGSRLLAAARRRAAAARRHADDVQGGQGALFQAL